MKYNDIIREIQEMEWNNKFDSIKHWNEIFFSFQNENYIFNCKEPFFLLIRNTVYDMDFEPYASSVFKIEIQGSQIIASVEDENGTVDITPFVSDNVEELLYQINNYLRSLLRKPENNTIEYLDMFEMYGIPSKNMPTIEVLYDFNFKIVSINDISLKSSNPDVLFILHTLKDAINQSEKFKRMGFKEKKRIYEIIEIVLWDSEVIVQDELYRYPHSAIKYLNIIFKQI